MSDLYDVRIGTEASADILELHRRISVDSPQNATVYVDRLLNEIDALEIFPHRYKTYHRSKTSGKVIRSMPAPPFIVYYRILESERIVRILKVHHGARRQPTRFE
jgi:plasmid stabilization system protein ParE